MPVHPQVQIFLDMLVATNLPPYEQSTVEQARERMGMLSMLERPPESVTQVQDLRIAGRQEEIPLRIYSPHPDREQPALLYFHGGGWVVGSIDSHDRLCRALANASDTVVISVDYRLAPEHRFPAAIDDCEDALRYVMEHAAALGIDRNRVAVGGDSAGGNLAAVVCLRARESGGALPAAQVLLYPATGHGLDTPSRHAFAEGYLLTAGAMRWFSDHYLRSKADAVHPHAAPRVVDDLSGLPPAFLITAEFDPLRDEGEEYGQRLEQAGVSVTSIRCDGMIHGFLQLTAMVEPARAAIDELANWLRLTLQQAESQR